MWKRDLSRFFLQLPLDPLDYDKVGCVWRGQLLFFTSYVWGCRHAGMNGQRVTNMVSAIHRSLGTLSELPEGFQRLNSTSDYLNSVSDSFISEPFNTLNYSDDFSDIEPTFERATLSFSLMGWLLEELGLSEAPEKAIAPCQVLNFLGIEFDTRVLEMRVDSSKCCELKGVLKKWINKTVASKSDLQSILGKLLWVSKAVKYSRCFVMRIIAEVKKLNFKVRKSNIVWT